MVVFSTSKVNKNSGGSEMNEFISIIGNVGFPIAVSAYLLIRIEGKINDLTSAINDLREAVITIPRPQGYS